ncbi:hypothetical protein Smp_114510 [Schistosoma mansoni]|uniref:hypothetical protein n=1 Tax=Schistosoma mansoni TaxID=6183 RepID=UPI00022C84C7|nr:hypothetical protein Smp_114510 [Schistosoma mansoni]|eukprot:XP_018644575.1 hypothetical protein Smp_114510 [Schistosoma mansoni]
MCMDEVIQHTTREHGAKMGDRRIDSILLADDVMIFAESKIGMQNKLNLLNTGLEKAGLLINFDKK